MATGSDSGSGERPAADAAAPPGPPENQGSKPGETVQIVDHALTVLRTVAEADRPRGVRELSRLLMISKSSTQRILTSLERVGLVALEEDSRKYVVGPAALTLAWKYSANSDLVSAASETAARIAAATRETACVSTVVDGRRVTVYEAESSQPLRLITGVGRPYSLFTGATGRVLLGLLPESQADRYIARGVPAGGADAAEVAEGVAKARAQGYAVSRGEWIDGGCGVAVPIGTKGSTVAALSIYGPEARLTGQRMVEMLPTLHEGAQQIAARWRHA